MKTITNMRFKIIKANLQTLPSVAKYVRNKYIKFLLHICIYKKMQMCARSNTSVHSSGLKIATGYLHCGELGKITHE